MLHPGSIKYFQALTRSIEAQSLQCFDLLVVNDSSLPMEQVRLQTLRSVAVLDVYSKGYSPAFNRQLALEYALNQGYKKIIPIDSDDMMHPQRIQRVSDALDGYDLVVHDLSATDDFGTVVRETVFANRPAMFQEPMMEAILQHNFIGFSNSGFNADLVPLALPIPLSIVAVDWWLASLFLEQGATLKYLDCPLAYYRQHSENIAGINDGTLAMLSKTLFVRMKHYQALLTRNHSSQIEEMIRTQIRLTQCIKQEIERNPARLLLRLGKSQGPLLWWELPQEYCYC